MDSSLVSVQNNHASVKIDVCMYLCILLVKFFFSTILFLGWEGRGQTGGGGGGGGGRRREELGDGADVNTSNK